MICGTVKGNRNMGLKEIFKKQGGLNLIKQYHESGVLKTALGEFFLLGRDKKALEILDKEKNKTELASIYLTISEIYKSVGKLDRSLEYSQRVYDIKKSDEDEYMMKSLFRIIETYISNYEYDMAKKYCKIALASSIKNKNRLNEYRVLKYYSDMHKAQNENIIAIEYLHKCINIISELNDEKILADLYINLGELYSDISKEKELEYYQKGVCIYKNLEII